MKTVIDLLIRMLGRLLGPALQPGTQRHQGPSANEIAGAGGAARTQAGGQKIDGPNGFLWKPVSDSDGKLAILTPKGMTGDIQGVRVLDAAGRVLEQGRRSGVGNGDREHFRFTRPGASFPPNSVVEVLMKDGSTKRYTIANPAARND